MKPICQEPGCEKPATCHSIPNNASDPHFSGTFACDEHLSGVGLTYAISDPKPEHYRVYILED